MAISFGGSCVWSLFKPLPAKEAAKVWAERRNVLRSTCAGALQPFVESAMLFFPIAAANFDGYAGVQAFKSEGFKFLFRSLVSTNQTLHVGRHGEAFSVSLLPNSRFQFWVDRDRHTSFNPINEPWQ